MPGLLDRIADGLNLKAQTLDSLPGFLWGPESKSGVSVTWAKSLEVMAMLACCRVVADGIAQCGVKLMRPRKGGIGSDEARDHPLYRLLWRRPNDWQTAYEFWETIVFHMMLVGNAYVYVSRLGDRIIELIVLEPQRVTVTQMPDRTLYYDVIGEDQVQRRFTGRDIWHLRGPSWNGWMGMETIRLARETIGLAIALEASHARMHRNSLQPAGVYAVEGELKNEQHEMLVKWIKKSVAAGDPFVLDRGAKWTSTEMKGVDAQHLETRRFQLEEICRGVRVMPIMIGLAEKTATYASAEQMFLAHVVHTETPWGNRIEQSAEVALLTEQEQAEGLTIYIDFSQLMRGDYKSLNDALKVQRDAGVINANEWRIRIGMNPREDDGGDEYIVNGAMAPQMGLAIVPLKQPDPNPPA
jgi:HK97 family phage portal protein